MVLFGDTKSSEDTKTTLKNILRNQQAEIDKLNANVRKISEVNKKLQEKYEFILETLLEKVGKGSNQLPIENTNRIESHIIDSTKPLQLSDLQLLMLLEQSKATNRTFAVSVNQLIIAYNIESSNRTLRNKLGTLEMQGLITSFGTRPKYFFITIQGQNLLQKQKRGVLSFEPL